MVDSNKVRELCDILKKDPNITQHYTSQELYNEVSRLFSEFMGMPPKSEKDLIKRFEQFEKDIFTEKESSSGFTRTSLHGGG